MCELIYHFPQTFILFITYYMGRFIHIHTIILIIYIGKDTCHHVFFYCIYTILSKIIWEKYQDIIQDYMEEIYKRYISLYVCGWKQIFPFCRGIIKSNLIVVLICSQIIPSGRSPQFSSIVW